MSNKYNKRNDYVFTVVFGIITLAVIGFAIADRDMVEEVFKVAQWKIFGFAAASALIAYSAMSLSILFANKLFQIKVSAVYQFLVNFVTLSIGNLMDFGGAVGYSLRGALLKKKGADFTDSLGASIFHSYFMFLILLLTLPVSIFSLLQRGMITPQNQKVFILAIVLSIIATTVSASVIFIKRVRLGLMHLLSSIVQRLFKKDIKKEFEDFSGGIDTGIANTKRHPWRFVASIFFVILYWAFSMLVLWLCFLSLGIRLDLFVLMVGFAVGITITTFSFIPGGIGIQEASTAGVISLLGVDFHVCVLVTFIFRVLYYLQTTFISLLIYWLVLRREVAEEE